MYVILYFISHTLSHYTEPEPVPEQAPVPQAAPEQTKAASSGGRSRPGKFIQLHIIQHLSCKHINI